jgi:holin-like protein
MIESLAVLLILQLCGEIVVQVTAIPVPGPVIGMIALSLILTLRGRVPQRLRETCQQLLSYLALLFVPAGVGILLHLERVKAEWLPLTVAVLFSTLLAMMVTAWVMQATIDWQDQRAQRRMGND